MHTSSATSLSKAAPAAAPEPILTPRSLTVALSAPKAVHRASLGSLLSEAGVLDAADIRSALENQKQHPDMRLGDLLLASGKLSQEELYRALSQQMGVPYVHLGDFEVDPAALALLPQEMVRTRRVMPLMLHEGRLVLATDDPADSNTISAVRFRAQRPVEAVLANPVDLDMAIAAHYPPFGDAALVQEAERLRRGRTSEIDTQSPEKLAAEKPIVRLVCNLLLNAIQRRASDLHLRPREHYGEARYRIDGSLVLVGEYNVALIPVIVARVKVLAGLDITERRRPQDGAIHMETPNGRVDMRVSIMPAAFGENVVIRILDRNASLRRFGDVGLDARDEKRMRRLIDRNNGLILVTGPTGSGKTTTLYAALQELNDGKHQIVTVEDPIEYRLDGLVQIQAQPNIDWGFAQALRHILRHDPDIILIGEIRDAETAKAAIESALTGHLVFSTLHTNSAAQTITRLLEIGIPAYLVNATLAGVLAQRLARRNCTHCRAPEQVGAEIRELLGIGPAEQFWRGTGCDECFGTGYRGRIAVHELLEMTPALRELVNGHATHDQIETLAVEQGMRHLTDRALELARVGTISADEVLKVKID